MPAAAPVERRSVPPAAADGKMIECPQCNQQNPANNRFCSSAARGSLVDTLASPSVDQEQSLASSEVQGYVRDAVQNAIEDLARRVRYIVERRLMADADRPNTGTSKAMGAMVAAGWRASSQFQAP